MNRFTSNVINVSYFCILRNGAGRGYLCPSGHLFYFTSYYDITFCIINDSKFSDRSDCSLLRSTLFAILSTPFGYGKVEDNYFNFFRESELVLDFYDITSTEYSLGM